MSNKIIHKTSDGSTRPTLPCNARLDSRWNFHQFKDDVDSESWLLIGQSYTPPANRYMDQPQPSLSHDDVGFSYSCSLSPLFVIS